MPSSSHNPDHRASGGAGGYHTSYALHEYTRAEPTITEELSGAAGSKKQGKGKKKTREVKAKEAIKDFDAAWKAASK
ncbi:hypothetical protein GGS26DRAFT_590678 [Hypomontagnella submonticulosa]|nr:hypothetical protein GGS26DRAFT_590678 [Hypomontagnella submonticulosa]